MTIITLILVVYVSHPIFWYPFILSRTFHHPSKHFYYSLWLTPAIGQEFTALLAFVAAAGWG
ncbi:MAG TPA: hypothetical protein PLO57_09555, partial [Candidatus Cloacimonadota bacterium]|nr:hypothetical protein [Candidatus Cloacimonadota bacterium]